MNAQDFTITAATLALTVAALCAPIKPITSLVYVAIGTVLLRAHVALRK